MLQAVLSWLGGPIVRGAIEAYKLKLEREGDQDRLLADLAARDLAVQQRELELRSAERIAIIGHWSEPTNLLGYICVFHIGVIVVTNALHGFGIASFAIPAIHGQAGDWLGMIASFFVGTRGAVSVASIFRRR